MTAPLDLEAIEARCEAATEGPWEHQSWGDSDYDVVTETDPSVSVCRPRLGGDSVFIAHAREDIPALVAEVRRLRDSRRLSEPDFTRLEAENERLRERIQELEDDQCQHVGAGTLTSGRLWCDDCKSYVRD